MTEQQKEPAVVVPATGEVDEKQTHSHHSHSHGCSHGHSHSHPENQDASDELHDDHSEDDSFGMRFACYIALIFGAGIQSLLGKWA